MRALLFFIYVTRVVERSSIISCSLGVEMVFVIWTLPQSASWDFGEIGIKLVVVRWYFRFQKRMENYAGFHV